MAVLEHVTSCSGVQKGQEASQNGANPAAGAQMSIVGSAANPTDSNGAEDTNAYFPVTLDLQKEIFNSYLERIRKVQNGERDIFFPSMLDMEEVKNFKYSGDPYNVAVIDVGGTVLKVVVLRVCADSETMRPKFPVLSSYNISYKPLDERSALKDYRWNEWVAEALARKTGLGGEDVKCAALTFSYPLIQQSLSNAVIKSVAKNWAFASYDSLLTENIVDALNTSMAARGFGFKVSCVLNDAVATYMAGLAESPSPAQIAIVLGTGANGSFEMSTDGRMELLNNEVARFGVPGELLTEADQDVIDELEQNGTPYQKLEVLIAGYKFVDIIKRQLLRAGFGREQVWGLNLDAVIDALRHPKNGNLGEFEREVRNMALSYKHRAGKILAAIILAISSTIEAAEIRVIMNGSVCQHSLDQRIICDELKALAAAMGYSVRFVPVSVSNASLVGAALAAAVAGSAYD